MITIIEECCVGCALCVPFCPEEAISCGTVLRRYRTHGEVATPMRFLAGDESRYCTGGVYRVDGGLTAYFGAYYGL
jgi:Na+-translocating ferredoxin:NAD+ oxidoreductase RNF subunit RnfB